MRLLGERLAGLDFGSDGRLLGWRLAGIDYGRDGAPPRKEVGWH
jgi:hypothetical protein